MLLLKILIIGRQTKLSNIFSSYTFHSDVEEFRRDSNVFKSAGTLVAAKVIEINFGERQSSFGIKNPICFWIG